MMSAAALLLAALLLSATAAYNQRPMLQSSRFLARRLVSRRSVDFVRQRPASRRLLTVIKMGDANVDATPFTKSTNRHKPSPLAGMPIGPSSSSKSGRNPVIIRYMYEGGHISQGRLIHLHPSDDTVPASQVIRALRQDGVDFDAFYACAYESSQSTGGWLPLEKPPRDTNPWSDEEVCSDMTFAIPSDDADVSRRIDIKLFRRPKAASQTDAIQSLEDVLDAATLQSENDATSTPVEHSSDALHAISASVPGGKLSLSNGYFGIGVISPKTSQNVGTLWRSAFQLGASVIFTIGGRYKASSTDTLNVPARIPLIELDDWNSFVEWGAPKAAVWVAEMGGTPLKEFEHPRNAIYVLGSEDHGLPKSVLRGCREVVSLESELYGSYNVAVAGSIVMYDRLMKMQAADEEQQGRKK